MKSKNVLDAVSEVDGRKLSKAQKMVLESLVEDVGKMDDKFMTLEKKVENLEKKFDEKFAGMQGEFKELSVLVKESIDRRNRLWNFLSELIKQPKFWIWITVLTVLAYGVSIADLKGLIGG